MILLLYMQIHLPTAFVYVYSIYSVVTVNIWVYDSLSQLGTEPSMLAFDHALQNLYIL